ncbi:hypothetical protein ACVJF1_008779 [Bradyrhizobium diazoefficiens]
MIAIAAPQQPRPPQREAERERRAKAEQDLGGKVRVGLRRDRDQHGGDAGETNKAALYRMMGFTERLGAREDPAQDEENEQQRPDDGGEREQDLADDRRQMPDLMRGAPGIAEAGKAKHDAEEGGRHDRRLESATHCLPQSSRRTIGQASVPCHLPIADGRKDAMLFDNRAPIFRP